ncbi:MAG: AAA family ATPase [Ignisphaera sp.]|uniref:Cytidylate kinase n=1 Tax=Ignisphaera aggregans TaxID=334771 RepID=A0A7C4NKL5_9CREN
MVLGIERAVIAIGGPAGSGKTTIAKLLAKKLRLRHLSVGYFFRKLAQEKGLTIEELSEIAQQDPSIDRYLDSMALEEAKKGGIVIDGHAAPWLLKDVAHLRVAVIASPEVRYRRLAERDKKNIEEIIKETKTREEIERNRYRRYYGIDIEDYTDFDLVINTERFKPEEVVEIIVKALELRIKHTE